MASVFAAAASDGPNWAEVMTAIATGVLALGVLIALFQLRELRRDRHLHWIFEIGLRWDAEKLEKARTDMYALDEQGVELETNMRRWLDKDAPFDQKLEDEMTNLMLLPNFFEDVALMVRFGHIDLALVWESLSGPIALTWKRWEPALVEVYRPMADPYAFTQFQALAEALADYEREGLGTAMLDTPTFRARQLTKRLVTYAALLVVVSIVLLISIFMHN